MKFDNIIAKSFIESCKNERGSSYYESLDFRTDKDDLPSKKGRVTLNNYEITSALKKTVDAKVRALRERYGNDWTEFEKNLENQNFRNGIIEKVLEEHGERVWGHTRSHLRGRCPELNADLVRGVQRDLFYDNEDHCQIIKYYVLYWIVCRCLGGNGSRVSTPAQTRSLNYGVAIRSSARTQALVAPSHSKLIAPEAIMYERPTGGSSSRPVKRCDIVIPADPSLPCPQMQHDSVQTGSSNALPAQSPKSMHTPLLPEPSPENTSLGKRKSESSDGRPSKIVKLPIGKYNCQKWSPSSLVENNEPSDAVMSDQDIYNSRDQSDFPLMVLLSSDSSEDDGEGSNGPFHSADNLREGTHDNSAVGDGASDHGTFSDGTSHSQPIVTSEHRPGPQFDAPAPEILECVPALSEEFGNFNHYDTTAEAPEVSPSITSPEATVTSANTPVADMEAVRDHALATVPENCQTSASEPRDISSAHNEVSEALRLRMDLVTYLSSDATAVEPHGSFLTELQDIWQRDVERLMGDFGHNFSSIDRAFQIWFSMAGKIKTFRDSTGYDGRPGSQWDDHCEKQPWESFAELVASKHILEAWQETMGLKRGSVYDAALVNKLALGLRQLAKLPSYWNLGKLEKQILTRIQSDLDWFL